MDSFVESREPPLVCPRPDAASVPGVEVACIVHDLKNPLSTVGLAIDVLDMRVADASSKRLLDVVRSNLDFMARLVNDLLDTTGDGGRMTLCRSPTPLAALLESVLDRTVAGDRGRVVLELRDCPIANIDAARIERVVANLLANALAYSPAHSTIVVRLEQREDVSCISVIDRGPGLTADEAVLVFDRYRRGRAGNQIAGTGLGLYVCRRIVELHGGRIEIEAEGCGSRFYLELPGADHDPGA